MNLPEKIASMFVEPDDPELQARADEVQELLESWIDGLPFSTNEDGDGQWVERQELAFEFFEAQTKDAHPKEPTP